MKHPLLLTRLAFAFAATTLHADDSRFTDGPHVGYVTSGDTQSDEFVWGWQAGFDVHQRVMLEAAYSRLNDQLPTDQLFGYGLPAGAGVEVDMNTFAFTAKLHLLHNNYSSLFVGGGTAYYLINEDTQDAKKAIINSGSQALSDFSMNIHDEFGFHAVVGVEVSLAKHWEVFAEYRHAWYEADMDVSPIRTGSNGQLVTPRINDTFSYDHALIRLGLNYRF